VTAWAQREYTQVAELRGPLLVVRGVEGVGWDEFATIQMETGQTRHGLVLEADRDLAVVQVLEGTESQGRAENRSLEETLSRAWAVLVALPRSEPTMLPAAVVEAYYPRDGAR
jgi:vacuolar-type H+-ATPase subunit B/Vma2